MKLTHVIFFWLFTCLLTLRTLNAQSVSEDKYGFFMPQTQLDGTSSIQSNNENNPSALQNILRNIDWLLYSRNSQIGFESKNQTVYSDSNGIKVTFGETLCEGEISSFDVSISKNHDRESYICIGFLEKLDVLNMAVDVSQREQTTSICSDGQKYGITSSTIKGETKDGINYNVQVDAKAKKIIFKDSKTGGQDIGGFADLSSLRYFAEFKDKGLLEISNVSPFSDKRNLDCVIDFSVTPENIIDSQHTATNSTTRKEADKKRSALNVKPKKARYTAHEEMSEEKSENKKENKSKKDHREAKFSEESSKSGQDAKKKHFSGSNEKERCYLRRVRVAVDLIADFRIVATEQYPLLQDA